MKKALASIPLAAVCLALGVLVLLLTLTILSKPELQGKVALEGLDNNVEIIRDSWGVPHIFAQDEHDLVLACGYVHAQDRMWQMDLTRRAAFGRLSEVFGKDLLDQDKLVRTLGLGRAVLRDSETLSAKTKELLTAYSRGINNWLESRTWQWPLEFLVLRYRPEPWTIQDSLAIKEVMSLLLCMDFRSEAVRARLLKKFGAERAGEILEEEIADLIGNAQAAIPRGLFGAAEFQGSNNWVLAGTRTETGKPLLANDPHLEISVPPVWYEIHLHCPTLNAVGVSLPGVPLVIIGHNAAIAWGITNSAADVQDLFVERIDLEGEKYLDQEGWKPLRKDIEEVKVRGRREPEHLEVRWTARGPVITPEAVKGDDVYSLRWTLHDGDRAFEAIYLLNKARNWEEFTQALRLFGVPSQNFVYADREGSIGYYLSGRIPLRPRQVGVFPSPGWAEEGWQGDLEEEEKPHLFNPPQGYIITANHKMVPDGYPHYISVDWDVPFRARRIEELLLARKKHSLESMKRIQNDIFNRRADHFLPMIKSLSAGEGEKKLTEALRLMGDWDQEMSSGPGPALYEVFLQKLTEGVFGDELGEDLVDFDRNFRRKQAGLLRILKNAGSPWFDRVNTPAEETLGDILKTSLVQAFEWLEENQGPPQKWDWARLHALHYRHPLGSIFLFSFLNRGPFPVTGNAFTVKASYAFDYTTQYSASYRQIIDLSDWENSVCVLTSGQSGHFLSPFYDDQLPLWLNGEYHPMLFRRESIEAQATGILRLEPRSP